MKRLQFILLTIFVFQLSFSQGEKLLQGKVSNRQFPISGVDVINYTTQKSTVTNINGLFYISAKPNDIILFYHKNFIQQKVILNQDNFKADGFAIELAEKPIELQEVVVDNKTTTHFAISQASRDEMKLIRNQSQPKVEGINDGTIVNGMDFVRLGKDAYKMAKKLFKSNTKVSNETPKIEFKKYVAATIKKDYYTKDLKLKPEEIPLFLNFCDSDPNSKTILETPNVLSTMDFLRAKNIEFQQVLNMVK